MNNAQAQDATQEQAGSIPAGWPTTGDEGAVRLRRKAEGSAEARVVPAIRGFGFTVTAGGWPRYWYIDPAGVKRWADNDEETK